MNVNIGYAWGQLIRAQQAAEQGGLDERARALEAVAKWQSVVVGMCAGTIDVGSRTPTRAPAWVTLDVVTGGFATGSYAAGGPLRVHEHSLAEQLGVAPTRVALNLYFLMAPETAELLASGRYRIDVPEEGALLAVAWLRGRGEVERASELVYTLAPWFETLRFYPVPAAAPPDLVETVRLQSVGTTAAALARIVPQQRLATMRETVIVWKPLRARALALVGETAEGPLLGRRFPAGWHARVAELETDLARAGEPATARAREIAGLVTLLARCARDPESVTGRAYHEAGRLLARQVAAHGLPGTPAYEAERAADARAVAGPTHADLRRVLVERLRALPAEGGVDPDAALAPVTAAEAARFGVPAGTALPAYLEPKVARSADASLAELVERGVIASAEVFARLLPQITAQMRAQTLAHPAARQLYTSLYTAFRRRRGLLLVNYQHQVRFAELPWVAVLEAAAEPSAEATARTREVIASASGVALRAFPYTILPNKLVTELTALTGAAELALPLVEELAADIFGGAFTAKYLAAAKVSARLVAGTLYQRYYAIDVAEIARIPEPVGHVSPELAAICERRAQPLQSASRSPVARNGMVIEQGQILTTHNLAVLFDALPLRVQLGPQLRSIAETCARWAIRRLAMRTAGWHQLLVNLKNAAYAWRQMVFYASFMPEIHDLRELLAAIRTELARVPEELRTRFEPAVRGLELAAAGVGSETAAFEAGGGRVFTGWTTDRHWLAPPRAG